MQPQDILLKLEERFKSNIKQCLPIEREAYKRLDRKARVFAVLGQVISEDNSLLPHQKELVHIFDEVFADVILSLYFSACGLHKPAQIVLRRAIELGIAIIYLWDFPLAFWNWNTHDHDLNFREMVEYLIKDSYKTFLKSLNPSYKGDELFNEKEAKDIYRILSNTIHGKMTTHVSYLPNGFSHDASAWCEHLKLVERVLDLLISISHSRFFPYIDELNRKTPIIETP